MSADIVSMDAIRAQRVRKRLFETQEEDEMYLRIAEARGRYAIANNVLNATHQMQDGIHAAHCFHEYRRALEAIGQTITDDQMMFPLSVEIGQTAREAVARLRSKLRAKTERTD